MSCYEIPPDSTVGVLVNDLKHTHAHLLAALKILRAIQFGGPYDSCPWCRRDEEETHAIDCRIYRVLNRE